jgi:hypothetical protein
MFSFLLSKSNRFYTIHIVSFELELTSYLRKTGIKTAITYFLQTFHTKSTHISHRKNIV